MIQRVHLASDYKALVTSKEIAASSDLYSLMPFIDEDGLMRVGGRLENSSLNFESKHPIILPKGHELTEALIDHFHRKMLHGGPQAVLASIRLQYWPIGGRKAVAKVINKCIRCFRVKPKTAEHLMGNLPADRVQANRAFLVTGMDFCGPFLYRSEVRNKPAIKCYICLFVCFSTKAVHLELVSDLSTPSFIAALKRFICTRGKPKTLWSDNATNFVGAKNELAELKQLFFNDQNRQAIHQQCLDDGIDFRFIPPRSPHFGGLWEASVKTAKFHFWRVVGLSVLNFDELRTLVVEISAVMNSRPLCPLTENPEDLDVLTPAHFLIGSAFTALIEPDVSVLNINRLDRWQRVCYMQQIFWKKWSAEYLTLLQQRSKWRSRKPNIEIGTMVLVKDENLPPLKWPVARVIETIKGSDEVARVAVLRTASGTTRRAINKLCVLPMNPDVVESLPLPTGGGCLEKHQNS
ncbi:uncharacterized protein LOC118756397 [Rhagoletis pomonella]|uniref:uncharacterized protein LOC118756397 n=1 Tax=Rhagoletis pomonella TaxID=28610 RepID=UPI00178469B8|nr:uncharacterized protein LOC118756397 [Rhagoletis pomonella]